MCVCVCVCVHMTAGCGGQTTGSAALGGPTGAGADTTEQKELKSWKSERKIEERQKHTERHTETGNKYTHRHTETGKRACWAKWTLPFHCVFQVEKERAKFRQQLMNSSKSQVRHKHTHTGLQYLRLCMCVMLLYLYRSVPTPQWRNYSRAEWWSWRTRWDNRN